MMMMMMTTIWWWWWWWRRWWWWYASKWYHRHRETSNIRGTKAKNLNVYRLILQLSLPNPRQPCVQSRMKMSAMLQLHLSNQQFYHLLRWAYNRGLTVSSLASLNKKYCTRGQCFLNIYKKTIVADPSRNIYRTDLRRPNFHAHLNVDLWQIITNFIKYLKIWQRRHSNGIFLKGVKCIELRDNLY